MNSKSLCTQRWLCTTAPPVFTSEVMGYRHASPRLVNAALSAESRLYAYLAGALPAKPTPSPYVGPFKVHIYNMLQ